MLLRGKASAFLGRAVLSGTWLPVMSCSTLFPDEGRLLLCYFA